MIQASLLLGNSYLYQLGAELIMMLIIVKIFRFL